MKIFLGQSGGIERLKSALCGTCFENFKKQFQRDAKGKIELDLGQNPKLCEDCKRKMEEQFRSSFHPDRS